MLNGCGKLRRDEESPSAELGWVASGTSTKEGTLASSGHHAPHLSSAYSRQLPASAAILPTPNLASRKCSAVLLLYWPLRKRAL